MAALELVARYWRVVAALLLVVVALLVMERLGSLEAQLTAKSSEVVALHARLIERDAVLAEVARQSAQRQLEAAAAVQRAQVQADQHRAEAARLRGLLGTGARDPAETPCQRAERILHEYQPGRLP